MLLGVVSIVALLLAQPKNEAVLLTWALCLIWVVTLGLVAVALVLLIPKLTKAISVITGLCYVTIGGPQDATNKLPTNFGLCRLLSI